ncbi:hypothetical protein TrVE_jg5303 [Triparma verrucosa]|uniref:Uncharacterized protein n=1 Tax=Triparma verrucosa TaxID=1606542 RepID=A0A9W7BD27_9STRA|nr:hypothetical protein TrVE_jg5303 [Triparma verrucosa]
MYLQSPKRQRLPAGGISPINTHRDADISIKPNGVVQESSGGSSSTTLSNGASDDVNNEGASSPSSATVSQHQTRNSSRIRAKACRQASPESVTGKRDSSGSMVEAAAAAAEDQISPISPKSRSKQVQRDRSETQSAIELSYHQAGAEVRNRIKKLQLPNISTSMINPVASSFFTGLTCCREIITPGSSGSCYIHPVVGDEWDDVRSWFGRGEGGAGVMWSNLTRSFTGPKEKDRFDSMLKVESSSLGLMGVVHFDTRGGIWTVHGLVVSPQCRVGSDGGGPDNAEEIALFLLGAVVARSIFEGGTVIELDVGLGDFMTLMREKMGWRGTQGGRLGLVSDERWEFVMVLFTVYLKSIITGAPNEAVRAAQVAAEKTKQLEKFASVISNPPLPPSSVKSDAFCPLTFLSRVSSDQAAEDIKAFTMTE